MSSFGERFFTERKYSYHCTNKNIIILNNTILLFQKLFLQQLKQHSLGNILVLGIVPIHVNNNETNANKLQRPYKELFEGSELFKTSECNSTQIMKFYECNGKNIFMR